MSGLSRIVLVMVALLAACGGSSADSWVDVSKSLTHGLDETSDNLCVRGDSKCIDVVAAEMTRRLELLTTGCHHNSAFALLYLRMTETVGADVAAGSFDDPAYLNHLDAVFADFYFDAFDGWYSGDKNSVPAAWQIAFEAADQKSVAGLGDLLLGANAHIRRDLAFVIAEVGAVDAVGNSRRPDYDAINPIIEELTRPALNEIAARLDPTVALFDVPFLDIDERSASAVLSAWRDEAFEDAARLLAADTSEQRSDVAAQIDAKAEETARLIELATSYPPLLPSAAIRATFCRASS